LSVSRDSLEAEEEDKKIENENIIATKTTVTTIITTAGQANQLIVSGEAGETSDEVGELLAMIDECHK